MLNTHEVVVPKSSYVKGLDDFPLMNTTVGAKFDEIVAKHPKRLALSSPTQDIRLTYEELSIQVNNLATGLISLGLGAGDRLGIWSANRAEWAVTQYAAAKLGLILVCINPSYTATEFEHAINTVECKALIMAERLKSSDYVAMLQEVAPEINDCQPGHLVAARLPSLEIVIKLGEDIITGCFQYADVLAMGASDDRERLLEIGKNLNPLDSMAVLFTSGTTGRAKGAIFNHYQLLNNGNIDGTIMKMSADDVICLPLPLFHIFGMLTGNLIALIFGASIVYSGEVFVPKTVLSTLESEKCTVIYGVPTLFKALLDHPGVENFDLTALRTGLVGGAMASMKLAKDIIERLHIPGLMNVYGMTESSATITLSRLDDSVERRVGTSGKVIPHLEVKLIDTNGEIVPVGSPGELCMRGFTVMQGYWGDPENTARAIDSEGWLHTGDSAIVDEEGYFIINGRLKEIIIRGGENIPPGDIEECLLLNPKILSVVAVGVPDEKFGEEVCACVVLRPGRTATEDELRAFCKGKISHYKIPKYIRFVESYPMTASGKVKKHILEDQTCNFFGIQKEI